MLLSANPATAQTPPQRPAVTPYAAGTMPPAQLGTPQRLKSPGATFATTRWQSQLPVQAQQPPGPGAGAPLPGEGPDNPPIAIIQTEPPGIERIAQAMQSDEQIQERIRQENREREPMERVVFPPDPILSTVMFDDKWRNANWPNRKLETAPYYVCYGRLRFEQINAERYGWDLGIIHPIIAGGMFLYDFVTLPYHLAMEPFRCFEYNTGYCLPGDPVPLLLYPLELSATGTVAEVGTILCLVAIFP